MTETSNRNASFQTILETAERLIREKGCRHTTLQHIIDGSGLSKGAIYHYVSGKDELFGLILKSKVEAVNESFIKAVSAAAAKDATVPIQTIAKGMADQTDNEEVSNKIFTYLLSQVDNPKVAAILEDLYDYSFQTASRWIETGQQAGALPREVDAARMASLFMVFSYGLRVHNVIVKGAGPAMQLDDIFKLIFRTLQH
ncbi:MAG: hypothetical protein K0R28_5895 [Paenibacillus sp.]|nr:hypothetical protein [Paenibacillus sp.]